MKFIINKNKNNGVSFIINKLYKNLKIATKMGLGSLFETNFTSNFRYLFSQYLINKNFKKLLR